MAAAAGFWLCLSCVTILVTVVVTVMFRVLDVPPAFHWIRNPVISGVLGVLLTGALVGMPMRRRKAMLQMEPGDLMHLMRAGPLDSGDPAAQQLRNLVEEMSVASGVPVPEVFVIQESGINAFAMGWEVEGAGLWITEGAMHRLTRDELQAVVAHEFSHILNGDMRLNTRMLMWLSGLFGVAQAGRALVFAGAVSGGASRGRSRSGGFGGGRGGAGSPLPILLLGFALMILGSLGVLLGKLLQLAMSRQREFLADAAAVQFTRNPAAVAGALKKLGPDNLRARLGDPVFMDFGHMLFADAQVHMVNRVLATHPPLEKRILRVAPDWDGSFPRVKRIQTRLPEMDYTGTTVQIPLRNMRTLYEMTGRPDLEALSEMHSWLEKLPDRILIMAREADGARALVLRLLLQEAPGIRERQWGQLQTLAKGLCPHVEEVQQHLPQIAQEEVFPLLDLCAAGLRRVPKTERPAFRGVVKAFVEADAQVHLVEYAIQRVVDRVLLTPEALRQSARERTSIRNLEGEVNLLLSLLAWLGSDTLAEAEASFEVARKLMTGYHAGISFALRPRDVCTLASLDRACTALAKLPPGVQKRLMAACEGAIMSQGEIRTTELLAFRAVAAALNVPVCPVLRAGTVRGK